MVNWFICLVVLSFCTITIGQPSKPKSTDKYGAEVIVSTDTTSTHNTADIAANNGERLINGDIMIIIIIVAVILLVTLLVLFIICKYVRRRKQKKAMDKEGGKIRAIINQRSIDTPISGSTNPNAFATENENQMIKFELNCADREMDVSQQHVEEEASDRKLTAGFIGEEYYDNDIDDNQDDGELDVFIVDGDIVIIDGDIIIIDDDNPNAITPGGPNTVGDDEFVIYNQDTIQHYDDIYNNQSDSNDDELILDEINQFEIEGDVGTVTDNGLHSQDYEVKVDDLKQNMLNSDVEQQKHIEHVNVSSKKELDMKQKVIKKKKKAKRYKKGMKVRIKNNKKYKSVIGIIRYVGIIDDVKMVGMEILNDDIFGESDGMYNDNRYFQCKHKKATFLKIKYVKKYIAEKKQNINKDDGKKESHESVPKKYGNVVSDLFAPRFSSPKKKDEWNNKIKPKLGPRDIGRKNSYKGIEYNENEEIQRRKKRKMEKEALKLRKFEQDRKKKLKQGKIVGKNNKLQKGKNKNKKKNTTVNNKRKVNVHNSQSKLEHS